MHPQIIAMAAAEHVKDMQADATRAAACPSGTPRPARRDHRRLPPPALSSCHPGSVPAAALPAAVRQGRVTARQ